jgi:HTH-type transcriptional regulator/antitoxin HigA
MSRLPYTVIKNKTQYKTYCKKLLALTEQNSDAVQDEIELLTLLIEKWDKEHSSVPDPDPVALLHLLMAEHQLKAKDLVSLLDVSKGLVSDILNYRKGLSKENIRKLAQHFRLSQEAFNRPYALKPTASSYVKKDSRIHA